MSRTRLDRVRARLADQGVDALLVGPSADLRWLVGYEAMPLERLTMLVVPVDGDPTLFVPGLEVARAEASGATDLADLSAWGETDDPIALVAGTVPGDGRLAVQDQLWTSFTLALQETLPGAEWVPGSTVTAPLRMVKDDHEVAALHAVGAAIDDVHARVADLLRPGRTETEVGRDIAELIRGTHDQVSFVIVASGPNGASPHHELSDRVIEVGDPVVVDIGGVLDGYCSDETRNYVVGDVDPAYRELHDVLEAAQAAGVDAVRPGVTAESVDAAARAVIDDAGWGEQFIHRTGHGIGVDGHEPPWIVAGDVTELAPGMAFSVEPGIYVAGRHGARIEDIVVVTEDGVASANHRPRGLTVA
ncbi:M24 family metallopeptidase [Salsipaludibacter albus]|uniref:M24 family metallopeptidase n=1 Tax=Salsipaludibacter albus TaxID=2849650 RepID=UPI001EE4722E|nr:Xaa-Pro peptidase family protein [Salsipaludibacter albus]MBY5161649.1 Xaa-Pro peptidase family protein [Salsipaludibacter albus]